MVLGVASPALAATSVVASDPNYVTNGYPPTSSLVVESDGTLWAFYERALFYGTPSLPSQIFCSFSHDGGDTWTEEQVSNETSDVYDKSVAIDSNDWIHVVWPSETGIKYRRRTASGWGEIIALQAGTGWPCDFPVVAVDGSNNVHVAWQADRGADAADDIRYTAYNGTAWQAIEGIGNTTETNLQDHPAIAIDSSGNTHVAWRAKGKIYHREKIAATWQAIETPVDAGAEWQEMCNIVMDEDDNIHLLFLGKGWGANPTFYNIEYVKKTAGTWGAIESVTDSSTSKYSPSMTITKDGTIHVIWTDDGLVYPANEGVLHRAKTDSWQAVEAIADTGDDYETPNALWANYPVVGGVHTNIPDTLTAVWQKYDYAADDYKIELYVAESTAAPPAVTTEAATDITYQGETSHVKYTSATLNGNLTDMGTAASVNVSFEYGLTDSYGNTTAPQTISAPSIFNDTVTVTGIAAGTTYHFRAKAVGDGTSYGNDTTFIAVITSEVITLDATSITSTTVTLNGNLASMGESANVTVLFDYFSPSTTNTTWGTSQLYMNATGNFSIPLTELSPDTLYHFYSCSVDNLESGAFDIGNDMTFTTWPAAAQATTWSPTKDFVTGPLDPIDALYTELQGTDDLIFGMGKTINDALAFAEVPQALFWFPVLYVSAALIALVTYFALSGSNRVIGLLIELVVICLLLGWFSLTTKVTLPLWPLLVLIIPQGTAIIVATMHYGV